MSSDWLTPKPLGKTQDKPPASKNIANDPNWPIGSTLEAVRESLARGRGQSNTHGQQKPKKGSWL